ncbi:MAG: hypothetical protein LBC19_02280 [Tannerella sp.]|jgi:hypothetical protein|nr:hypothetical protein [Tannerella sp.]
MKKNYLSIIVCALCFSSCAKENMTNSALSIKAVIPKVDTGNSDTEEVNVRSSDTGNDGAENDTVMWCRGLDIEWYNTTTDELKISNNTLGNYFGTLVIFLYDKELLSFSMDHPTSSVITIRPCIHCECEEIIPNPSGEPDKMYVPGEYFPDFERKSECHYYISSKKNHPVFTKSFRERNKWNWAAIDALLEEQWKAIEPEWNIFIEQLKKEGKYRE